MALRPGAVPDLEYLLTAGRIFLDGQNPYEVMYGQPGAPPPYDLPFFYPFPAVLMILPLAILPASVANGLFTGICSGLLAWCITRDGLWRLHLFASAPFVMAATLSQLSPLIMLMAFVPWAGFLAIIKPNLGLAMFARRPSVSAVVGVALISGLSLVVFPEWPFHWLNSIRQDVSDRHVHAAPVLQTGGFLLLLAVIAWRRTGGRLLLVMSLIPQQLYFYDQLLLWLIPRTRRQSVLLTGASQAGMLIWYLALDPGDKIVLSAYPFVLAFVFLPALAIVLFQHFNSNPRTA